MLYYRLFQENARGLERELVIREFMGYLSLHQDSLAEEETEDGVAETPEDAGTRTQQGELDFGFLRKPEEAAAPGGGPDENSKTVPTPAGGRRLDERVLAGRFLRRLTGAGWLGEETLADFSRVINITAWGKPFFEALVRVE
ncbi:MAG: DUF5716 family protein, partial [Treponema sp.]|nr:DUF5716 family protein [Treponema sp.]